MQSAGWIVVVVAQGIIGVYIERGLKAFNEGQSTHHMGGATGSFQCQIPHHDVLWRYIPRASYFLLEFSRKPQSDYQLMGETLNLRQKDSPLK